MTQVTLASPKSPYTRTRHIDIHTTLSHIPSNNIDIMLWQPPYRRNPPQACMSTKAAKRQASTMEKGLPMLSQWLQNTLKRGLHRKSMASMMSLSSYKPMPKNTRSELSISWARPKKAQVFRAKNLTNKHLSFEPRRTRIVLGLGWLPTRFLVWK